MKYLRPAMWPETYIRFKKAFFKARLKRPDLTFIQHLDEVSKEVKNV